MRAVAVVMALVGPQYPFQMARIHDQQVVEAFVLTVLTNLPAWALAFGVQNGVRST
jgi:hypothetical protein